MWEHNNTKKGNPKENRPTWDEIFRFCLPFWRVWFFSPIMRDAAERSSPSAYRWGRQRWRPAAGGLASAWRSSCWRCSCCSGPQGPSSPPWQCGCPRCRTAPGGRPISCRGNWTNNNREHLLLLLLLLLLLHCYYIILIYYYYLLYISLYLSIISIN